MNLKSTYDKIAKNWSEDHANDTWWIAGTEKFSSFLKKGDSVLDVGCASGLKSRYLTQKLFVVTGIDFSGKMIEFAQQRMPTGQFFVKDINEPLDFKSKFDGIFAQAVLLHISKKNVKKVIQNLIEFLNPNGYFYIAVKKLRNGAKEEQVVTENDYGYEYERFFSFYTSEELKKHLNDLKLNIVYSDITSIGSTEWIQMIAQK